VDIYPAYYGRRFSGKHDDRSFLIIPKRGSGDHKRRISAFFEGASGQARTQAQSEFELLSAFFSLPIRSPRDVFAGDVQRMGRSGCIEFDNPLLANSAGSAIFKRGEGSRLTATTFFYFAKSESALQRS
jgi:hypothetical protein